MLVLALFTVLAAAPESPSPLPEKFELAVHDVFAFTPPCKVQKVISTPESVSVNVEHGRVLILGEKAGAGALKLLCVEELPATSEPVGADKAKITCPAGTKPDVYEKATGERISSCLLEKPISVSLNVLALPPKSRVLALYDEKSNAMNTFFLGEARAFWPSCSVSRIAVSDGSAAIDPGDGGSMVLRTAQQGVTTVLAFCSPTGRMAIPVRVVP